MVNNTSPKTIPVSQDFEVRSPVSEKGFTVTDSDWSYLHKKISQITTGEFGYHTAGAVALGVAGSALIGAITLPATTKIYGIQSSIICWLLFGLFGICGLMAFLFSREQRKLTARTKEDALEEMARIEKRCNPNHVDNQSEEVT
jgi:uncharacterized membrane protein YuzA (DUF378 family)